MERRAKEHLYEVDLMRTFIILGVVCVHIVSFFNLFAPTASVTNVEFDYAITALHFTRESFMFITGLVLFITYYHRSFRAVDFWIKRFKLIVIPYGVWTLLYILFEGTYFKGFNWSVGGVTGDYVSSLLLGSQFYLYFLVVSMQLYLLFPIAVKFLKRTEKVHAWVFIGSFILELVLMWFNQDVLQNMSTTHLPAWIAFLDNYRFENILTYQFWFISGAIIAIHYEQIREYAIAHARLIVSLLLLGLVALWINYSVYHFVLHDDETMAVLVLQPMMIPYSFVVTIALWRAGLAWSAARMQPAKRIFSQFIKIAAAASFGVFLVHPILLHYSEVVMYSLHLGAVERLLLLPVVIVFVYGGSILIVRFIARIPLVSYIVGQKTNPPKWISSYHLTRQESIKR